MYVCISQGKRTDTAIVDLQNKTHRQTKNKTIAQKNTIQWQQNVHRRWQQCTRAIFANYKTFRPSHQHRRRRRWRRRQQCGWRFTKLFNYNRETRHEGETQSANYAFGCFSRLERAAEISNLDKTLPKFHSHFLYDNKLSSRQQQQQQQQRTPDGRALLD